MVDFVATVFTCLWIKNLITCCTFHKLIKVTDAFWFIYDCINIQIEGAGIHTSNCHVLLCATLGYIVCSSLKHQTCSINIRYKWFNSEPLCNMSLYKLIIRHTTDDSASGTYLRTRASSMLLDWRTTHTPPFFNEDVGWYKCSALHGGCLPEDGIYFGFINCVGDKCLGIAEEH